MIRRLQGVLGAVARDIGTAQSKNRAPNIFEHCFLIEPDQYPVKPVPSTPHCHHLYLKLHLHPSCCKDNHRHIYVTNKVCIKIKHQCKLLIDNKNSEGALLAFIWEVDSANVNNVTFIYITHDLNDLKKTRKGLTVICEWRRNMIWGSTYWVVVFMYKTKR